MSKDSSKLTGVDLDRLSINTIRFLSIDAVQKANSGHPGLPMGAAAFAYVLWTRFLKHNPHNPNWFDRDRFILSAGHGSMLLYSLLYLTGYDVSLDQIKQFRQWGSITPGHPESELTPGVEVTTGPLGQGFGNGVGIAMAEAFFSARYNRPEHKIIDHFTYGLVSDGDLMEGVSAEAASLAGHLQLGKLIYLYDNNHVTLSAATDLTFTEDVKKRFDAYGWHTQSVEDGNDLKAIERAIKRAQRVKDKPSLILVNTHIGYGSPDKQDSFKAHGEPLGAEEVKKTKENLGWPLEPEFYVPDEALTHFREAVEKGKQAEDQWQQRFSIYSEAYPELAEELHQAMLGELPGGWDADIPEFSADPKGIATRVASGKVMNAIAPKLPTFLGGSADLDPSTYTALGGEGDFESPDEKANDLQGSVGGGWKYSGNNLHFGVREHAMGAILNGLAAHGGAIPFGATFLIFSDYMRPPMRLAALAGLHVIYVFTHDSIALGEDGPTHQPVEQLLGLRSIPNMLVIRPADANETAAAWRVAIEHTGGPVALALTRQKIPILDLQKYPQLPLGVRSGGYVLEHATGNTHPDITLIATGSEVQLALAAREELETQGVHARVVSLPCWNLFDKQPDEYKQAVLPPDVPMLAIEAGASLGWRPYVGPGITTIGVDRFGASAPGETVMREYGFTVDHIVQKALSMVEQIEKA
ncbi:MAG TPA: transketolase [Anaerolineales bacterium]|jgi:transketolase|nr:transketolase [Anaerolineales bacterium]